MLIWSTLPNWPEVTRLDSCSWGCEFEPQRQLVAKTEDDLMSYLKIICISNHIILSEFLYTPIELNRSDQIKEKKPDVNQQASLTALVVAKVIARWITEVIGTNDFKSSSECVWGTFVVVHSFVHSFVCWWWRPELIQVTRKMMKWNVPKEVQTCILVLMFPLKSLLCSML